MSRNLCRWNFDLSIPYCQTRITQEIEFFRNRPNSSQCLISVFGVYLILSFCVRSSRWYNIAKMNCDDYRWHNIVDGTFADKLQTSTPVEHPTFEVDIVEVIMWSLKLHAASFFDSKPSRAESRRYGKIWPWDESLDRRRFYMERFSRTSFHFLLLVLFSRQPSQPSRQARQPMHNTVFASRVSLFLWIAPRFGWLSVYWFISTSQFVFIFRKKLYQQFFQHPPAAGRTRRPPWECRARSLSGPLASSP